MDDRIVREPEVRRLTGISRSQRWRLQQMEQFPRPVQLGARSVGWRLQELMKWMAERPRTAKKVK